MHSNNVHSEDIVDGSCAAPCLIAQSCPTLCDLTGYILPGSSVYGDSPGKNTGVGCYALLQGIYSTQESNSALPHCRQILYHLSHQGSTPQNTEVGSLSLLQEIFPTQGSSPCLLHWQVDSLPLSHLGSPIYVCIFVVVQLCLTLCNHLDCSLPGSSVYGDSPGKNTGVRCHPLLQGLFPIRD